MQATNCVFTMRAAPATYFSPTRSSTLDPINPTTAARLVQPLGAWRRHNTARQDLVRQQIERPCHAQSQQEYLRDGVEERNWRTIVAAPFNAFRFLVAQLGTSGQPLHPIVPVLGASTNLPPPNFVENRATAPVWFSF
jgi:hypothetical protein